MTERAQTASSQHGTLTFALGFGTWDDATAGGSFSSDRLVQFLAADSGPRRLLVVDAMRNPLVRLRPERGMTFPASEGRDHLRPMRLRRSDPVDYSAAIAEQRRLLTTAHTRLTRRGWMRSSLLVCNPLAAAAASAGDWDRVTYYGWDDWASHPAYAQWWPAFNMAYSAMQRSGHQIVGVSQRILDKIDTSGDAIVVPNGVVEAEWHNLIPAPQWFLALPRPRFLYSGTVDSRIDIPAIRALAQAYPESSLTVMGTIADRDVAAGLAGLANVYVKDWQPREVVRGVTATCDVALVPHLRNDLTLAMSPLKLYEYLAAGRPVVARDLPPIAAVDGTLLYSSPQGFVDRVGKALEVGPMPEADRRQFVKSHGWNARFSTLLDFALGGS